MCDVERQIIEVLSVFFSGHYKIELDYRLVEDLHVDSLEVVEIVMVLNERLCIELTGEMVAKWETVRDICYWVVFCKEEG
ncbi:acyl carrier protein [Pseudomonas kilonensis]|uniref:acyl carrier protein n=1 Tax=Pseudomonas kilonensis TaxID=132476 RepID=UPI00344D064B